MKTKKAVDFQKYLAKQLKNHKIKKYYNEHGKKLEKKISGAQKEKPPAGTSPARVLFMMITIL